MNKKEHDKLKEIVAFTAGDGSRWIYSKLSIQGDLVVYDGSTYETSLEVREQILEGILNYEIYKLSMTRSDAEDIIRDKADQIIEEVLSERINNLKMTLTASIDSLQDSINNCDTIVNGATRATDVLNTTITDTKDILKRTISEFNPEEINAKVTGKLDELITVKSDVMTKLEPITNETGALLNSLRELVTPKK